LAIYRYPLQAPVENGSASTEDGATEAIDYVCFQRTSVKYDDNRFRGYSLPGSNSAKRNLDKNRVYLAMPKGLQTQYSPSYRQVELGAAGAAAIQAVGNGSASTEDMAQLLGDTAGAVLPEFASGAFAGAINGAAQMGGLAGGIDANSLQALTRGRVFNPYKENVFTGINFRQHSFNFKLVARSPEEAKEMQSILNYFKEGAVPNIGSSDDTAGKKDIEKLTRSLSGNRFFTVPDSFNIKFIRLRPDGQADKDGDKDFMHFKIHPSVCTGIQVNYTPDGQYTAFKKPGTDPKQSIQVPALNLTLSFTETKLVTTVDINDGF
jgi:hypothetical protein